MACHTIAYRTNRTNFQTSSRKFSKRKYTVYNLVLHRAPAPEEALQGENRPLLRARTSLYHSSKSTPSSPSPPPPITQPAQLLEKGKRPGARTSLYHSSKSTPSSPSPPPPITQPAQLLEKGKKGISDSRGLSASDFMGGGDQSPTKSAKDLGVASPGSPTDRYAPVAAQRPVCDACEKKQVDVVCDACKKSFCDSCCAKAHEGETYHDIQPWNRARASKIAVPEPEPQIQGDEEAIALRRYLTQPVKEGEVMQCFVKRNKTGAKGHLFPVYELYSERNPKKPEFLCAAKRKLGSKDSNYILSLSSKSFEKDVMFLGKLRGNLKGTEYMLWEGDVTKAHGPDEEAMLKNEIGCAIYAQQAKLSFLSKVPRKMTLILPRRELGPDGKEKTYHHTEKHSILAEEYRRIVAAESKGSGMLQAQNAPLILVNKEPIFNHQVNAFVLDFKGRVSEASVKNFQLVDRNNADLVLLQFGRVGADKFNMDFRYPLSPMQAFLACVTTFDKPAN
eukprot:g15845.t1